MIVEFRPGLLGEVFGAGVGHDTDDFTGPFAPRHPSAVFSIGLALETHFSAIVD